MFIVMHCGGMPFNGNTIKEKALGGSETAAYYVAKELAALGHRVTLFTNSEDSGIFDDVRYEFAGEADEHTPLGNRFTFYAENTPHDLLIIQRHPAAFERKWASKLNFWWLHDLAMKRINGAGHMWNVDRVLTVSEYHKKQVCDVWGLNPEFVKAITNGVDLSLFKDRNITRNPKQLVYSSRPERGLINLVKPGGIMEQLLKTDPEYHLMVCGYENTMPHMAELYQYLNQRCEELPNVTNCGALTKQQLADLMLASNALVYPTTFEEVSCITAMEAMAAGCRVIASTHAALPETCGDGEILFALKDGQPDEAAFINAILGLGNEEHNGIEYSWASVAKMIMDEARGVFAENANSASLAHHFMRHSDIAAMNRLPSFVDHGILSATMDEYDKAYGFYRDGHYAEHYAAYYEYEKNRGVEYGPEDVTGTARFQTVANYVRAMPLNAYILDYGCAHGHYTVALAKMFPDHRFIGVDLAATNVDKAKAWAAAENLDNVEFYNGDHNMVAMWGESWFDMIIAAEVVEHVGDPQDLIDVLCTRLTAGGLMCITTPYGPWEAQGYRQHGYWRAHLHHFEREDLHEMFGNFKHFGIVAAPSGKSQFGSVLGSYITTFTKPDAPIGSINYARKVAQTMPDQTLSVCMIAKDASTDIKRCLLSVLPFAQEIIIGIDAATSDDTMQIVSNLRNENPLVSWSLFRLNPVSEIGFAAARNETIKHATGDWILWIDADEVLVGGNKLATFLRNNMYNGYAVKQHHFSVAPAGIIKTDLPCRLFRARKGIEFFGLVHEHPEIKMNDGLGHVMLAAGVEIAHYGYSSEGIRRGRFSRNIGLLERDRKENPERVLGKFLWLRDLAQMCQYDEEAGYPNDRVFNARADEGIALWLWLLENGHTRLAVDGIQFYSELVMHKGIGFAFGFSVDANKQGGVDIASAPIIQGHFANKEHAFKLMQAISENKVEGFDSRYF